MKTYKHKLHDALALVKAQGADTSLWGRATTIEEKRLQHALISLHTAIIDQSPEYCAKKFTERMDRLFDGIDKRGLPYFIDKGIKG